MVTRSRIVRLILSVLLASLLSGATSNQTAQDNERITPFDPIKFMPQMKVEAAKDKIKIRTCYIGANVDFSFAAVADDKNDKQLHSKYDSMADRNGQIYQISKEPLINSNDIDFVCVDKSSHRGIEQYSIFAFFKESSLDKVYTVTESLIARRIACLKSHTVISVGRVLDAIAQSAQLAVVNKAADVDWFIQGLTPANIPVYDQEKAYIKWLERRVQNYPDDFKSLENLARLYAETKSGCIKSLAIYERVIKFSSSGFFYYYFPMLNSCYIDSSDFEREIVFYSSLIGEKNIEPMTEVYIRIALASAYDGKRDTQKTLQELSLALAATKPVPTTYPSLAGRPDRKKFEKILQDQKTRMIQQLEAEIDKINYQGKSN